jgi:hypothetical protein
MASVTDVTSVLFSILIFQLRHWTPINGKIMKYLKQQNELLMLLYNLLLVPVIRTLFILCIFVEM